MSQVERYWIDPSRLVQEGWHQDDTCVVKDWAYDRVVAGRDALQQRLTAADERADTATSLIQRIVANFDTEIEFHEDVEPNDLEHDQVLAEMRLFLAALKPAGGGCDESI